MKFILGKKIEMSQIFDEKRNAVPVTLIEAGPCYILQVKNKDKDGYEAVQIGFIKKTKKIHPVKSNKVGAAKPQFNRVKKTEKGKEFKFVREFRIMEHGTHNMEQGDEIKTDIFEEGEIVKVSGVSKGKGFQGVVKRWGFHGRSATHGTKHEQRKPGSIGSRFPQRVLKGKKMAGRMGTERVTVKNLKIIKIDKENNIIAVKGAVPGNRGSLVEIRG